MLKRTPLFEAHRKLGARLVEFGGWEMPVQYSSIVDEHLAVRKAAGIFDISHMGEMRVSGAGAQAFLNSALTNDVAKLAPGQGQYTLMCQENAGVIDDLYAYRIEDDEYLLIVNASRIEADWDWLQGRFDELKVDGSLDLKNASAELAAVAVQGPRVCEFIDQCVPGGAIGGTMVARVTELKKNELGIFLFGRVPIYVARTGYTGEDGFEIIAPAETIESIWSKTLTVGHQGCLQPAGLGARDTLRTEVCYPLYGHELDENTTPIEAGLSAFVALEKGEFIGRATLARQKAQGVSRRCVAFQVTERGAPPRPNYPIWTSGPDSKKVGAVSSGTQSPSLNLGIGLGYIPSEMARPGTRIEIEIRGRRVGAEIVRKPIYRKSG